MTARFYLLCALLLIGAGGLFAAAGKYQKAIDGKTLVWNSDPKPGDRVDWQGDRDSDGYATGLGAATWYTGKSVEKLDKAAFFARYYGKMVRGKWDGPVNVHSRGKVAHAYFTDGSRTSQWAGGSAREWKGLEPLPAAPKTNAMAAAPEKPEPTPIVTTSRPTPNPVTNVAAENAATPAKTKPEPKPKQTPMAEAPAVEPSAAPIAAAPAVGPSSTPEQHEVEAAAPAPQATTEIARPTPPEVAAAPSPPEAAPATPAEVALATPKLSPPAPRARHTPPKITGKKKMETKFDDSLRSLVGPPSSLRESSLATTGRSPGSAPAGREGALSEKEAIELANHEATLQGIDLSEFNAPSADYSATKDMWSVLYSAKNAVNENGVAHSLIVGVEDKTRKAYITSGK